MRDAGIGRECVAVLDDRVVQPDVADAAAMQLERVQDDVVHRVADEIGRPAQRRLRTDAHEAIRDTVSHHADVALAEIGFDGVVGADVQIVLDDVDAALIGAGHALAQ